MGDHHYVMKEEVVGCLDLQKKKKWQPRVS